MTKINSNDISYTSTRKEVKQHYLVIPIHFHHPTKKMYPQSRYKKIHTWLLVKPPKRMNNTHFAVHVSTSILGISRVIIFNLLIIAWVTCTKISEVLLVLVLTQKYLSPGRVLYFQIHLRIHHSNMGEKLVYYYLYYVEASSPMNVFLTLLICILLFPYKHNSYPFDFKLTLIYS